MIYSNLVSMMMQRLASPGSHDASEPAREAMEWAHREILNLRSIINGKTFVTGDETQPVASKDVVQRLETWVIDDADSEELYALLADAARELKDLQQFHDWASPQVHDHGRDVLEITRLRQYLGYISRMKCHPDKGVTMTTLSAAIQLAEQALSGDPSRTHDSERQQCIDQAATRDTHEPTAFQDFVTSLSVEPDDGC